MIEFLRDGDARWRVVELEPGTYYDGERTAVTSVRLAVRVQERWGSLGRGYHTWHPIQYDWESATPIPTLWQELKDWPTHPVRAGEPRAVARERWVIR